MKKMALSIAGSDPTGGAGLQADLKVMGAFGVHGMAVPTALTVQNTLGVGHVEPVSGELIRRQLDFLLDDIVPDALKTGMLYTEEAVDAVVGAMGRYGLRNLVVDPVAVSSSGTGLVLEGALRELSSRLLPLAAVVTPNAHEAGLLTGLRIRGEADMQQAARALHALGPKVVIITGGHFEGVAVDLYYDGAEPRMLAGEKYEGDYHGTGCAFSAALASCLAQGKGPFEAAGEAKRFVQDAIRRAVRPGGGLRLLDL